MLLHDLLFTSAHHRSDELALVSEGRRSTYGELATAARNLAGHLVAGGLRRGDRVVVYHPNSTEAVVAVFGILAAGGCCVVVDPATQAARLGLVMSDCSAHTVITPATRAGVIDAAQEQCERAPRRILTGDVGHLDADSFSAACSTDAGVPLPRVADDDLAAIIYTSGSTGRPKGVTFAHRGIVAVVDSVAEYLEHTADDVVLSVLQLAFGYGLLQVLVTFATGGTVVLEQGAGFPYDIVKKLRTERITGFAGVPTLFALLLQLESLGDDDFPDLRYLTNAAAALPQSFVPRLRSAFPHARLYLMHGQTECLRTTFLPPDECERRPGSVGRGMRNVALWLEDEHGRRVPVGGQGELVVSGPGVMLGYWGDPTTTAEVLRDGTRPGERILRTRDLFRTDEEGYFYFVSRLDDIIKCRGEKVSPLEIEELLYELDEVCEARVIGVPDEVLGHAIRAEIVLRDGAQVDPRRIRAYLRSRLEDVKVPREVVIVDSVPKTAGGKIKRRD